ncbi:uncharacterized protein LOC123874525 [Maniola jurtina]|uniref:uncharacterized protein LOC123874525 n=1 Tax=Maniola jurtina TaxID=191418 RepID=UPI001E68CD25|nr:uncharacterized protein LOC123874525 [Maniola jurtina]XP_045775903.1 uncharacterized protein LOC123874525 [Maniola jurtina]XP_045775914.1 uncharacterized protein LOC123874525 [Maniola jurtina]
MAEAVEAGASLAWRLLATLEVGSILVATSALIAYTTRTKLVRQRPLRTANSFLLTNSTNALGQEVKRRLEAEGCTVHTPTSDAASKAEADKVDCLVVIGAESKAGLDGISRLVSEDVYENLNLLESLARRVKRGGCIAWACAAGDTSGAYGDAAAAFDAVIQASLRHVAKNSHCDPIWVGRCSGVERAVERTLAELLPCTTQEHGFSIRVIRNAAHKVSEYLSRWLKMAT